MFGVCVTDGEDRAPGERSARAGDARAAAARPAARAQAEDHRARVAAAGAEAVASHRHEGATDRQVSTLPPPSPSRCRQG